VDRNNFKDNPDGFKKDKQQLFKISEKNKKLYTFIYAKTRNGYKRRLSNIHEACANHYCYSHIDKLFQNGNTRYLAIIKENNMSNFMFSNGAALISDGLSRFLLRARTEKIYTLQRKAQIYHQGDWKCQIWNKIENLKHYLNCCMKRGTRMTERHDNIGRILAYVIQIHSGQDSMISKTENYVNWNRRLKLPLEIQKIKKEEKELPEEVYKIRPNIWFYLIEKDIVNG
jgi:hypothetical protein